MLPSDQHTVRCWAVSKYLWLAQPFHIKEAKKTIHNNRKISQLLRCLNTAIKYQWSSFHQGIQLLFQNRTHACVYIHPSTQLFTFTYSRQKDQYKITHVGNFLPNVKLFQEIKKHYVNSYLLKWLLWESNKKFMEYTFAQPLQCTLCIFLQELFQGKKATIT